MRQDSLSFLNFFVVIWEKGWIIFLFTLVSVLVSALVSFYVLTPIYEAKADILISSKEKFNENTGLNSSIDESIKLVPTYQDIVLSPLILKSAQTELKAAGHEDLTIDKKDVQIHTKDASQVFSIVVQHEDPQAAKQIANALAKSFNNSVDSLMNLDRPNIKLLSYATVLPHPVKPNPMLIMGITFVLSLIVSIWTTLLVHNIKHNKTSI